MAVKSYIRQNLQTGSKGYGRYYAYADNEAREIADMVK